MKRLFCFLLALLTVLTAVPVFVLPSVAATATSVSAEDVVHIRFRMGDTRTTSANKSESADIGTLIAERKCAPGFVNFELPTDEECYTKGVNPQNIIGWYAIGLDGTFVDARAYNGTYQTADITFYPYLKSSGMGFNAPANLPTVKGGVITGLRSGWTVGEYTAKGFAPYKTIDAVSGIAFNASPWSNGGAYYASGGGGSALVLSPSASRVLAISWTAIADGKVDLGFDSFIFNTGNGIPANATAYLAVAVDGKIVWPTAIAGNDVALTGFEAAGYYKIALGNAEKATSNQTVEIKDGSYKNLSVTAGQSVRFIIGYSVGQTVELRPTVSYTEVGELSSAIVTKIPTFQSAAMDKENKPNAAPSSDTDPEITYPGAWEMITYPKLADITNTDKANLVEYYTKSTERTEFLTSLKDYGGAGSAPALFVYDVAKTNTGNWGNYYDIAIKGGGSPIGFRYTVEHAGYITPAFDSLLWQSVAAGAANPERTYVAIFADGVMIWPAMGTVTELDTWYQPFADENYASGTDVAAAANATIPEFYVQAGAKIDFVMYREGTGSIWNGCGNRMHPSISYQSAAFVTNFTASGTLGDSLSLNFYANAGTVSFSETVEATYLLADSLKLDIVSSAFGNQTFTAKNSLLTASIDGIAAKQMTDKVDYTLSATAKHPTGEEETVILQQGSISFADYLAAIWNNTELAAPTRELALATLRYGAAAQTYFGYNTNNLAGAGITDTPTVTLPEAADTYKQEGSGDYRFSYATLLLQDTVKLKLYIDATAAPRTDWEDLYLQIDGSTAKIPLTQRNGHTDGGALKVVISVPFSEFATDYTFRIFAEDGTQVSTTLTYSVASYAVRMQAEQELAGLLTAIRTAGVATDAYETATRPTDDGKTATKFVVLSDAHVGESLTNANGKLKAALQQIAEMGDVDVVIFPGDMTNNGTDTEYKQLLNILVETGFLNYDETNGYTMTDTQVSFVLGNHEFYRDGWDGGAKNTEEEKQNVYDVFEELFTPIHETAINFSTDNNGLDHTVILPDGTYIIGVSERDNAGTYGAESEAYLVKQVQAAAAADPTKPIFIYAHLGYGSLQGSTKMSVSAETAAVLNQYPQIVFISGHTHYASQNPYMIQQNYYTNLQVPTSGSKWWWVYGSDYDHPASYGYEAAQGVIISVTDTNVVHAQRYDFGTGENVGQDWVIDIPAILRSTDNFTYRVADRKVQALAPEFAETDAITVTDIAEYSAKITFPIAHIYDDVSDDVVQYYYVVVVDGDGEVVYSKRMLSEYYRGSRQNPTMTFPVGGLADGTTYTVYAVAESIFGQTSKALKTTFTTKVREIPTLENLTALLSVDYSDGDPKDDANNHTYKAMKLSGTDSVPTYENGRACFDGNCAYRYTLTSNDVAATKTSITLETVLVVNNGNKARPDINFDNRASIISNMEGGGFGLSYNYSQKTIYFSLTGLGVSVSKKITTETVLHIVATYDGTTLSLYINGELVASAACSSEIKAANTKSLFVGSDTNGSSGMQCPAICEVAYFNLYAEGVTMGQAELMYENYVADSSEEPEEEAA